MGLIFLGLEGMKESFISFATVFDILKYHFQNAYWYAVIEFALTAVIQFSFDRDYSECIFTYMIGFEAAVSDVANDALQKEIL